MTGAPFPPHLRLVPPPSPQRPRRRLAVHAIKIGSRFRQDHGDIGALARSIEAVGLLHPVVVTPSNELVCGERRIEAARLLGWQEIPARVVDIDAIVLGEHAENELRKDFTVSERVGIGRAVEESLGERRGRPKENVQNKIAQLPAGGKTRDIAAEKSGFGIRAALTKDHDGHPATLLGAALDKLAEAP